MNNKITSIIKQQPKLTGQIGNTIIYVDPDLEDKKIDIVENGVYTLRANEGYDGLNSVEVTAEVEPILQNKTIEITENGTTTITVDENFDGLSSVNIVTNVLQEGDTQSSLFIVNEWAEDGYIKKMTVLDSVPAYAFASYNKSHSNVVVKSLEEVIFEKNVSTIDEKAFLYSNVKKIDATFVENLWSQTFGYSQLESVSLPNIKKIGNAGAGGGAFYNCLNLKGAWIGSTVETSGNQKLSEYTFNKCSNIKKMYIDLPRATVEGLSGYAKAFSYGSVTTDVIVCSDDEDFITCEQFNIIDWSTYTE